MARERQRSIALKLLWRDDDAVGLGGGLYKHWNEIKFARNLRLMQYIFWDGLGLFSIHVSL